MTKQHVWPDRLRQIIPRLQAKTTWGYLQSGWVSEDLFWIDAASKTRPGSTHAKQVRKVCEGCNTGWMRQLEERAAPMFEPMIKGDETFLKPIDQSVLAGWIAMMVSVAEFIEPKTVAISSIDRAYIKATKLPPEPWRIWIASYGGQLGPVSYHHEAALLTDSKLDQRTIRDPCNTQCSTMLIGGLVIHAFSPGVPNLDLSVSALMPLWPCHKFTIRWPPAARPLNDKFLFSMWRKSAFAGEPFKPLRAPKRPV